MTIRQIFWLIAIGLVLSTFFAWIPMDVYERHDFLFSIAGAVLFFACLFMFLADYDSFYEALSGLFSKAEDTIDAPYRKYAPFSVIPAFILLIVLIFHQISRKSNELATNGIVTKGVIVGGKSTTTTRRFQSNTTYDVDVTYEDSLHHKHTANTSVSGSEFDNLYEGAQVDVVYSRKYPALGKAIIGLDELAKYKKIPREKITLEHLTALLDQKVKTDSILPYLNAINYEWLPGDTEGLYKNERMDMAIKLFPDGQEMAYVIKVNRFEVNNGSLESTFEKHGFKKKAQDVNGEKSELYYNDNYAITIEDKQSEQQNNTSNVMFVMEAYRVYHIARISGLQLD